MLKKIVEKRIESFKTVFPDFKISKGGNFYCRVGIVEQKKSVKLLGKSVTKNTLNRLGETRNWTETKASRIYLMSPKGKLCYSTGGNYKPYSLKQAMDDSKITDIFLIGKKYEWLRNHPNLAQYRFFQSFNSLKDAKTFLGFGFISDEAFYKLFDKSHLMDCMIPLIKAKDKKDAVKLLSSIDSQATNLLNDYIKICLENNLDIEIPAGKNKLKDLHDNTVWEINKANIDRCSDKEKYEIAEGTFEQKWIEKGVKFTKLNSPKQLYATGVAQKHCIGSYSSDLHKYSFYSILFIDRNYEIQIAQDGDIRQFYGYDNCNPPSQITDMIIKSEIDYKHIIRLKSGEKDKEDGYPFLKEFKHVDDVEDLINNNNDYDYDW